MSSELEGVTSRFDDLRARLDEVVDDDAVLAEIFATLEQAVAREAEVLDAILEQLPVGVTVITPSFEVMRFNRRAREITHRDTSAVPLLDPRVELFHLDGRPMDLDERPSIRALRGESSKGVVYEAREEGRSPYVVNASGAPIRNRDGEVIGAITVFEEITERRTRERADSEFVANAAHQLRTPLAAIVSAIGALHAGAKHDPPERDRFRAHIEREVMRMQMLTEGLLALARAERGDAPAPLSRIALRPLLERVVEHSTPKDGVDLELFCPEHLTAVTNEALISEALSNVVTNAVQHTTIGTVALRGEQRPDGTTIEVSDDGPGIAEQDRDRVFERFFRGSRPIGTGVGLGLAIAAAATQAAGGVLELVDSPIGACFRFTFLQSVLNA
jgi:PAS domain S-box-containing protein